MKKLILFIVLFGLALNSCSPSAPPVTPASPSETSAPSPTVEPSPTTTSTPVAIPSIPQLIGSTAPSLPTGGYQNRVYQSGNTYIFEVSSEATTIQYRYQPSTGSLNDLRIKINDGRPFLPSNFGGATLTIDGVGIPPWEYSSKFRLSHEEPILIGDSLEITWNAKSATQAIQFTYRFWLAGKTLSLYVDSASKDITEFTLDRSEDTPGAKLLFIPYLSTFNVLQYQDHFITAYFDWTKSSASGITGFGSAFSEQSFYFGQNARYDANTKGIRNPVHETIYFTVSDVLSEVFPNIPNPPSPNREVLANHIVLDMWEGRNFGEDKKLLEMLSNKGIKDKLLIIEHVWQNCGYDNCYPNVIPANKNWGGDPALIELSQTAKDAGYLFALHENYVDIYPNAEAWDPAVVALNPDGSQVKAWYNESTRLQSFLISPAYIFDFATQFSPEIHRRYETTASFYDVHTAANPSYKVDFNADVENNSLMSYTFAEYAKLIAYARQVHEGPILGEGGDHFLYAGIVDGVEAQYLADESGSPSTTPPIVDFALLKIHPLMVNHGVGYYERFFSQFGQQQWEGYTKEDTYQYMATEIAFCHAGFVPTPTRVGVLEWLALVEREANLVLPIQKQCALATPTQILYHVNGELVSVEKALIANQAWQIFVEYDSGLRVYVNRHPSENWEVTPSSTPTWVDYSVLINGLRKDYVGSETLPSYTLPPGGWLALKP